MRILVLMQRDILEQARSTLGGLSPYWWCQLLGWGVVIPYWLHFESPINGSYAIPLLILIGQSTWQIIATHQYRNLAHRYGWINRSGRRLVVVILIAYFLLLAQYLLMTFCVVTVRYGNIVDVDIAIGATAGGARYQAIWLLCFHGYHLARKSSQAEAEAARGLQLAAEAQLAKLQSELNPHFLFNALNSIKALTRENPALARSAVDRLAGLLRYSLRQSERKLVSLAEEIEMVDVYISLEKIRLEERLQFSWDLPLEIDECLVPPLSLHTLVENGVKHGVKQYPEGGCIKVRLEKTADYWSFTVVNTGVFAPTSEEGTGLKNLRRRLSLQYNTPELLRLTNETGETAPFTTAILNIPHKPT